MASVHDIVEVLEDEPAIIENMSKFGRLLGVKESKLQNLVKQINYESTGVEKALYGFIEQFVTDNGEKATVQKLANCLQDFRCTSGVRKKEHGHNTLVLNNNLNGRFKNMNIRIVRRNAAVEEPAFESPKLSNAEAIQTQRKSMDEHDAPVKKILQKKTYPPGKLIGMITNLKRKREGAEFDELRLKPTLERCGFHVRTSKLFGKADIIKDLNGLSEEVQNMEKQKQPVGGVLVAIMGHGRKRDILKTESKSFGFRETLSIRKDAIAIFKRVQAPKIFLINMCRGKEKDPVKSDGDDSEKESSGVDLDDGSSWEDWSAPFRNDTDISNDLEEDGEYSSWKDILVIHATYPGNVAWRNPELGTYFIQTFCKVVETHACREDGESIETLLNEVSEIFKSEPIGKHKDRWQSPTFESTSFNRHFMIKYNKNKKVEM